MTSLKVLLLLAFPLMVGYGQTKTDTLEIWGPDNSVTRGEFQSGSVTRVQAYSDQTPIGVLTWRDLSLAWKEYKDSCALDTILFATSPYWGPGVDTVPYPKGYEFKAWWNVSSGTWGHILKRTPTLEGFFEWIERKRK
jgi:hypothetical protein